jgi:hypothetical protein
MKKPVCTLCAIRSVVTDFIIKDPPGGPQLPIPDDTDSDSPSYRNRLVHALTSGEPGYHPPHKPDDTDSDSPSYRNRLVHALTSGEPGYHPPHKPDDTDSDSPSNQGSRPVDWRNRALNNNPKTSISMNSFKNMEDNEGDASNLRQHKFKSYKNRMMEANNPSFRRRKYYY